MDTPTKQFIMNFFVGRFWFNGKGILVPVLLILSLFLCLGMLLLFQPYLQWIPYEPKLLYGFIGLILLVGGTATWFTGRDFIKIDGKRTEIDLDNRFLFFKMKSFGIYLIILGLIGFGYGLFQAISHKL